MRRRNFIFLTLGTFFLFTSLNASESGTLQCPLEGEIALIVHSSSQHGNSAEKNLTPKHPIEIIEIQDSEEEKNAGELPKPESSLSWEGNIVDQVVRQSEIPLRTYLGLSEKPYFFSKDYFSNNIELWRQKFAEFGWLENIIPLKSLTIGTLEGLSCVWYLEHVGNHPESWHFIVDPFTHETETPLNMGSQEERFRHNLKLTGREDKTTVLKGYSSKILAKLIAADEHEKSFDFIYIDGSHQAPDVITDAVNVFQLLKKNGIMAFDDYWWPGHGEYHLLKEVKPAVDAFTNLFAKKISIIHIKNQFWLQKLAD